MLGEIRPLFAPDTTAGIKPEIAKQTEAMSVRAAVEEVKPYLECGSLINTPKGPIYDSLLQKVHFPDKGPLIAEQEIIFTAEDKPLPFATFRILETPQGNIEIDVACLTTTRDHDEIKRGLDWAKYGRTFAKGNLTKTIPVIRISLKEFKDLMIGGVTKAEDLSRNVDPTATALAFLESLKNPEVFISSNLPELVERDKQIAYQLRLGALARELGLDTNELEVRYLNIALPKNERETLANAGYAIDPQNPKAPIPVMSIANDGFKPGEISFKQDTSYNTYKISFPNHFPNGVDYIWMTITNDIVDRQIIDKLTGKTLAKISTRMPPPREERVLVIAYHPDGTNLVVTNLNLPKGTYLEVKKREDLLTKTKQAESPNTLIEQLKEQNRMVGGMYSSKKRVAKPEMSEADRDRIKRQELAAENRIREAHGLLPKRPNR